MNVSYNDYASHVFPTQMGLDGMSLRDYFAAQALSNIATWLGPGVDIFANERSDAAYKFADAMLKARKAKQ